MLLFADEPKESFSPHWICSCFSFGCVFDGRNPNSLPGGRCFWRCRRCSGLLSRQNNIVGLKIFQMVMLIVGLLQYAANLVFAFTRNSPRTRRVSDVVGFVLFAASLYVGILLVTPLEQGGGKSSELLFLRLISLGMQLAQVMEKRLIRQFFCKRY
jgi:hypothetical protein